MWRARESAAPTALRFALDAHPALTGWANLWRASGACSRGIRRFCVRPRDSWKDVNRARWLLMNRLTEIETAYSELETDAAFSNSALTLTSPPASLIIRFHGSKPFLLIITL